MDHGELTKALRRELEELIAEVKAKGPARRTTEAERNAVLPATKLEAGPPGVRSARPAEARSTYVLVH
jgi:hypothetical protein